MTEHAEEVSRLWRQGMTGREIAARLEISETSTYRILQRAGISPAGRAYQQLRAPSPWLAEAATRYASGETIKALADEFGVSPKVMTARLREHGVEIRSSGESRYRKWTDAEIGQICDLYREGFSQEWIAKKHSTSQTMISSLLRNAGVDKKIRRNRVGVAHMDGYLMVKLYDDEPEDAKYLSMRNANFYVLAHRLAMARHLGRPLTRSETVHHINGDRSDNRIENLQIRQGRHGKGAAFSCLDCGSHNVAPRPI